MEEVIHYKPVGVYPITNCFSLLFYRVIYGINDVAVVKYNNESKIHKVRIYYNIKGEPFIKVNNIRYYLNNFYKIVNG